VLRANMQLIDDTLNPPPPPPPGQTQLPDPEMTIFSDAIQ